jgi:hypothetical protein
MSQRLRWVVDIDIVKYFDSISHSHLRNFLDQRVTDGVIRWMIDKWLKAGVLEDGLLREALLPSERSRWSYLGARQRQLSIMREKSRPIPFRAARSRYELVRSAPSRPSLAAVTAALIRERQYFGCTLGSTTTASKIIIHGCCRSWRNPTQASAMLRQKPMMQQPEITDAGIAQRILYTSTDFRWHGGESEPPSGGWPLVAWAHRTVGVAESCAPSWTGHKARDAVYINKWSRPNRRTSR